MAVDDTLVWWYRRPEVLWRQVLDDVVLLAPDHPEPFAVARGAALWMLLERPSSQAELVAALVPEELRAGEAAKLRGLLDDLRRRRAVECAPW